MRKHCSRRSCAHGQRAGHDGPQHRLEEQDRGGALRLPSRLFGCVNPWRGWAVRSFAALSMTALAVDFPSRGDASWRIRGQGGQMPKHPPSHAQLVLQTLSALSVAFRQQAWSALQEFMPTSPALFWQEFAPWQEPSPTSPAFDPHAKWPMQDPSPTLPLLPEHGIKPLQELSPTLPVVL